MLIGHPGVQTMIRVLDALRRNDDGAAAVEFALVLMIFLMVVIAIMELGMIMLRQNLMDNAVHAASRFGMTGMSEAQQLAQIHRIVGNRTMGLVDMDEVDIDVLIYASFDRVGAPEPFVDAEPFNGVFDAGEAYTDVNGNSQWDADQGRPGGGRSGEIVLYRVTYDAPSMTGFLDDSLFGGDGTIRQTARLAVRNEPFDIREGSD